MLPLSPLRTETSRPRSPLDRRQLVGEQARRSARLARSRPRRGQRPSIFEQWPADFPKVEVHAVDLHENLDVSRASMGDYANRVLAVASDLPAPLSICGWSMGGLVAMLAALRLTPAPHSLVLIESSPPPKFRGFSRVRMALAPAPSTPSAPMARFRWA
jgi:pimeloyl-ACP methyl ester carboxylesterase